MTDPTLRAIRYNPPRSANVNLVLLPPKAPFSRRFYDVDLSALLGQLGHDTIAEAGASAEAPLELDSFSATGSIVTFRLGGGAPAAPIASVCISLVFADGSREDVVLGQPIQPAPAGIAADPPRSAPSTQAVTDQVGNAVTDQIGNPLTAG